MSLTQLNVDKSLLKDGYIVWMKINGNKYYTGVTYDSTDNAWVVAALLKTEVDGNRTVTILVVLLVFFIICTLSVLYALLIVEDEENDQEN